MCQGEWLKIHPLDPQNVAGGNKLGNCSFTLQFMRGPACLLVLPTCYLWPLLCPLTSIHSHLPAQTCTAGQPASEVD